MRKLKLIWDFRGPSSSKVAEHHEIHLRDYIKAGQLELNITGFNSYSEMHAIAYMVVNENEMPKVRDALKPHRGELY